MSLRSTVTGVMTKPPLGRIADGVAESPKSAFTGTRAAYFTENGDFADTPTYDRATLEASNRIAGPALIEEHASTTVLLPGDTMTVDAFGNLVIEVAGRRR